MHDPEAESSGGDRWARLRFAIVGPLFAAPPARGALRGALARLAAQSWRHPGTRAPVSFAFSTIERWYYVARNAARDPVGVLRPRRRKDAGQQRTLSARLQLVLQGQYQTHQRWSYQLHLDNLGVLIVGFQEYGTRAVQKHGTPGAVPSRDELGSTPAGGAGRRMVVGQDRGVVQLLSPLASGEATGRIAFIRHEDVWVPPRRRGRRAACGGPGRVAARLGAFAGARAPDTSTGAR